MSCVFCKRYSGLKHWCSARILVNTLSESFACGYYEYNGDLNDNNSD